MNKERLLNVAKACRESPDPDGFSMARHVDPTCGTPACAFGHYAARQDLQTEFNLQNPEVFRNEFGGIYIGAFEGVVTVDGEHVNAVDSIELRNHFSINKDEQEELFGSEGCCDARTAEEAAAYIEKFVAERAA